MKRWSLPLLVLAAGCGPQDNIATSGEELWQHFPFDGVRTWEYISTDLSLSYKLIGQMREEDPDSEVNAEHNVYHIDYSTDCVAADPECVDGEVIRTVAISSDYDGVWIHTFAQGSATVTFDPPLVVAPDEVKVGEVVETTTDGIKWNSVLVGFEPCDGFVRMQGESFKASNCSAHLTLSDGDNNPDTNYGLAGDYWVARGLGIVGISLDGDDGAIWGLSKMICEPDDDCNGEW